MLRHALIDDVVVHGPQLLADLGLDLTAQPCLGFRGINRRAHGISDFWLVRSWLVRFRLYRFEIGPTVFHFAIFPPLAHVKPALDTHKPHRLIGQRPVLLIVPGFRNYFRNFFRPATFLSVSLGNPEGEGVVPNSQAVLQHLPFLRRYARALTGSQASGDAYVAAALESLIASPDMLAQTANSRVGLYRLFTKIWGSLAVNGRPEAGEVVLPPEQHITQITPRPRQAFLLVALEGFSEEDAAQILDCDLATLRNLVEESGRELAAEIATDVLIIEDETFIAMDIEALVESLGHNVIGIARTHNEAVALAKKKRPGLILADIQLADGSSGLDAVNELLDTFEVPVIFITAYPERFLTGQRPEPAFLIAKPFQLAVVSAVVSQALFFGRKARHRERQPVERQPTA